MTDTMSGTGDAGSGGATPDSGTPSSLDGAVAAGTDSGASVGGGSVPAAGGDAQPGAGAEGSTPAAPPAPSKFRFADREFNDQPHAEQFFKTQIGKVPGLERRLAAFEQLEQENAELHRRLNLANSGPGPGGPPTAAPAKPKGGWGQELLENGDLQLMNELAETKGVGHALYALAEVMGDRAQQAIDQVVQQRVEERIGGIEKRQTFNEHMGNVMRAVRTLAPDYPELDEANDGPEAQEAREAILAIWKSLPRDEALGDPEGTLDYAVHKYRRLHGTPVFAVPPGTDASPSARVAAAAERAAGQTAVLDTGTPSRPRPNGVPRTPSQELEDELGAADQYAARGASGMDLGVRRIIP